MAPGEVARHHRYGVFRDLVLIARSEGRGGPFFLDRFESTRRDVLAWCAATGRSAPAGWPAAWTGADPASPSEDAPASRIDLDTARAFAAWRFCRLPRFEEWEYAATAGNEYRFPWGDPPRAEWANTPALGLGRETPVGTFESGRAPLGPYDLVGNVAEWTETLGPGFVTACGWPRVGAMDAVGPWHAAFVPWPLSARVALAPVRPTRLVAGGGFLGVSGYGVRQTSRSPQVPVLEFLPMEWSDDVGVRLATTPDDLLRALLREREEPPDPGSAATLEAFLTTHRAVLAVAWGRVRVGEGSAGILEPILTRALLR